MLDPLAPVAISEQEKLDYKYLVSLHYMVPTKSIKPPEIYKFSEEERAAIIRNYIRNSSVGVCRVCKRWILYDIPECPEHRLPLAMKTKVEFSHMVRTWENFRQLYMKKIGVTTLKRSTVIKIFNGLANE